MAKYSLHPERSTLHGSFSRDFDPVLTINSGDSVLYKVMSKWVVRP
jgi:acetamidase/formamidase